MLNKKIIASYLSPPANQRLEDIFIFESLPSTNDFLMTQGLEKNPQILACLAESQTAGKGRRGKQWVSPFAQNLYLSLLWHFPQHLQEMSGLSLVAGLAVTKALEHVIDKNIVRLKWPNDIMFQQRKLGGILVELKSTSPNGFFTVIGIGLNICMSKSYETQINQPWVNLEDIAGQNIDRNALAGYLLNELISALLLFQQQGMAAFLDAWQAQDITYNRPLTLETAEGLVSGIGRGINTQGHLLVELEKNNMRAFSSAQVSLRIAD